MILTTVCSLRGNFMVYLKVMVYSLRHSGLNPKKNPLYIFHDGIIPEDKLKLEKMWNVKLILVDNSIYVNKGKEHPKFWSFESFNPFHYKRRENVLFLDVDLITVNDITGIEKYFKSVSMIRERGRACFNAGVICIPESSINGKTYNELLDYPINWSEFGHDQQSFNNVFKNRTTELPKYYNMLVGAQDEFGDMKDVGIVHYIHKPDRDASQERVGKKYLDIWNKYDGEMRNV